MLRNLSLSIALLLSGRKYYIGCLQSCCVFPVVRSNEALFFEAQLPANFLCYAFSLAVSFA